MRISENFFRYEFECRCGCGFDTVDVVLVWILQAVRDHFGAAVDITGGNRCPIRNASTPGAAGNSLHMQAKAADFRVRGVKPEAVAAYLETLMPDWGGIGLYPDRVHVDVRPEKARWSEK